MTALLVLVAIANLYRAITQSIVYDEAATYLIFVAGPLEHVFSWYTANNHVLFTLLANAAVETFGVSEFTLRLPSVVAAIGYLVVASRLARRVSPDGRILVLTFFVLALNPLVFDFFSVARGYGLALFLFTFALLEVSREPDRQRWTLASLALGGAISANLAFAFPALAVWITASAVALRGQSPPVAPKVLILRFWLPGALGAAAFLAVPLRDVTLANFFYGAANLPGTVSSLVISSVRHHPTWWTETSMARWLERGLVGAVTVTGIAVAGVSVSSACRSFRGPAMPADTARQQLLIGGSFVLTIALLAAAHAFAGVLYPKDRTGLYLITLSVLSIAGLVGWSRRRVVRLTAVTTLTILMLTSIEQFTLATYSEWRYDAGSRRIAELIASQASRQSRRIRVATSEYLYQPALEFYRQTRFPDRLDLVVDGFDPARANEFDVLVVNDEDAARLGRSWTEIYVDHVSGARVFAASE